MRWRKKKSDKLKIKPTTTATDNDCNDNNKQQNCHIKKLLIFSFSHRFSLKKK